MHVSRPTNSDQYSYGDFAPAFREDIFTPAKFDDESDGPRIMCGFSTTPAAFGVSFLLAVEGCFWLANLFAAPSGATSGLPGLHRENPFREVQQVLLEALGFADIGASVLVMMGIYLTRHPMPKLVRRYLDVTQVRVATTSLGLTLAFRSLLLVAIAPWFGFMIGFDKRMSNVLPFICLVAYMTICGFTVWLLLNVTMNSLELSQRTQERLVLMDADERSTLLGQAYASGYPCPTEPMPLLMEDPAALFGCFPLRQTVLMYVVIVLVANIVWFVSLCVHGGATGAGWTFFTTLPGSSSTGGLEMFVCIFMVLASLLTLSVTVIQSGQWDPDQWRMRRRVTVTVLIYLILSIMRFALFVPITGMAIAAKDVCGLYSHAIQDLSPSSYTLLPLHCSSEDFTTLCTVLVTMVLDGYMIWGGVYKYWQTLRAMYLIEAAQDKKVTKSPAMTGWGAPGLSYGIGGPRTRS